MGASYDKAVLLYCQQRYRDCEAELRREIERNPNDQASNSLFTLCLAAAKRHPKAIEQGKRTVGLAPEWGHAHYVLAYAHYCAGEHEAAARAIREALRLQPSAYMFALLGGTLMAQRKLEQALIATRHGLELNPRSTDCLTFRAEILRRLSRFDEAATATKELLALDPENSRAHANHGNILLVSGDVEGAVQHLRESLRLDPTQQRARNDLLEAMRSRHTAYRAVIGPLNWLKRHRRLRMWSFLAVLFFVFARFSARTYDRETMMLLSPLAVIGLFGIVAGALTRPIFNLLLMTDDQGRQLLTARERAGALNLVAIVALCIIVIAADGLWGDWAAGFAGFVGLLLFPTATLLAFDSKCDRRWMSSYLGKCTGLGCLAMLCIWMGADFLAWVPAAAYVLACITAMWEYQPRGW